MEIKSGSVHILNFEIVTVIDPTQINPIMVRRPMTIEEVKEYATGLVAEIAVLRNQLHLIEEILDLE